MEQDPGTIERPARNAVSGESQSIVGQSASLSRSSATASSGIATIAAGRTVSASTARVSNSAVGWFERERRISRATLARMPVESVIELFFPELERKAPAIKFVYPEGFKARAYPDKAFVSGKGTRVSFWNIEQVLQARPERVYIVEGECDALALVEAGIDPTQVLAAPGAPERAPRDEDGEIRAFGYVKEALAAGLKEVRQIVWCGDADQPGLVLRAAMAAIFGAAKFRFVNWPEGVKDANDFLSSDGAQALRELVTEGSLPWPVEGLYRLSELPEPPPITPWHIGFADWDDRVRVAPGMMSVAIGHPGHGKSVLWSQLWFQVVQRYGVGICVASFETGPKPHIRRQLRTLKIGCPEREMSEADIRRADEWINDRYTFVVHPTEQPTLEWLLDRFEVAVVRHGARILQIDPWNRLEGARAPGETETDYVGRCLKAVHAFAKQFNVHVQIIAHPAKMDSRRRGQEPDLEDTAGSKNWQNMVDQGFVVHRPSLISDGGVRQTGAYFVVRKTRFEELGYPCRLCVEYDPRSHTFKSVPYLNDPEDVE